MQEAEIKQRERGKKKKKRPWEGLVLFVSYNCLMRTNQEPGVTTLASAKRIAFLTNFPLGSNF